MERMECLLTHTLLMKQTNPRLFEFRIKYNAGSELSAMNSFHYYMAETAEQAYQFHLDAMCRLHATAQHLSVERKNPWNNKWEDVSEVLNHSPIKIENEN